MEIKIRGWINLFIKIMCELSPETKAAILTNQSILVCPCDIFEILKENQIIEKTMNEYFFCFSSVDYGVAMVLVISDHTIKNGLILKC